MVAWHHSAGYPFYHAGVGLLSGRNYDSLSALIEGDTRCVNVGCVTAWTWCRPSPNGCRGSACVAQTAGVEPNWEMAAYYPTAARVRPGAGGDPGPAVGAARPAVYLREAAVIEAEQKKALGAGSCSVHSTSFTAGAAAK
ncbi:MAG: hypothetical protein HZY76_12995 [Anaerolineae bacterium]|nr:MAG: hypothetical protein HZY76_12995 [Anaerolineae bacterium]